MKRTLLLLLALAPIILIAQKKPALTLEDIWRNGVYYPQGIYGIQMLHDGNYYVQQTYDKDANTSLIIKYSFEKAAPVDTLFNASKASGLPEKFYLNDYAFSDKDNLILLETNPDYIYRHSKEAQYYIYNTKNKKSEKVFDGKPILYPTFSPDESKLAFVYQNNLYMQDLKDNSSKQLTTDGEMNKIINGKTDWVYEEEFALVKGFEWSPNGDKIAFYRFDESKVKQYQLAVYDNDYPTQYIYKYPLAGEDNSVVSIKVYDLAQSKTTDLPLGEQNDQYLPRMKWTKDNNTLAVQRLNRLQNLFELLFVNTTTGANKTVYKETSDTYIDITDNVYFLANNNFLITSEKEGYNQIYLYDNSGKLIRKITTDNKDVNEIAAVDEDKKLIYYTANDPIPMVVNLFSINFDGQNKKMLSPDAAGRETAEFSHNKQYYILKSSSTTEAPRVDIYKSTGKKVRTLKENEALKAKVDDLGLNAKEFFKIPIEGGEYLNAWMIKPPGFDPNKKYPVLLSIYGGPGHQLVVDNWYSMNDMWHQYLATKGIIVACVDNRGTGGRGAAFKKQTYKQLGLMESNDQIAAGRYMAQQPYVASDRVGIFGWSFGGYMAALNLMRGNDVFKMAVSVAPVTDWKYYDNIYTERFMQRPVDNPAGYDTTSVLKYVDMLKGDLLVIHGTYDDNVHPHNTMALITEMVKKNKKFDSEFYPDKNHGISGGNTRLHIFTRITDFILEHL